jgi:hypothetical protein
MPIIHVNWTKGITPMKSSIAPMPPKVLLDSKVIMFPQVSVMLIKIKAFSCLSKADPATAEF